MKLRLPLLFAVLLASNLFACNTQLNRSTSPSPTSPLPASPPSELALPAPAVSPTSEPAAAPNLEPFTRDELFAQGGGGCGMTLWQQEAGLRPEGFLFFNRLHQNESDQFAIAKINREFVRFQRIAATGQEFYGQQTSQTFTSEDGAMQLQVDVTLGQPGEIESVAIDQGTIQIEQNGQTITVSVWGDAGC